MEWYTLDASFRKSIVIEDFASFIWTERYQDAGDFQIVIKSTYASRTLLTPGTWITRDGSTYVMQILTVSDDTGTDGTRNLTVTGTSLEALLKDRVAMPALGDTTTTPAWVVTDTPGNIIRYMFTQVCVDGTLDPLDTVPFYHTGTLLPAGSIPEDSDIITVSAQPDTLFNTIQKLAQTYFLGFRFVRNGETSQIYFEVYTGNDRTSGQTVRSPVIFNADMDNLEKISTLTSTAALKTVAYVFAQNDAVVVNATFADPTASGAARRVLLVNSSNSSAAGPALTSALNAEGLIALTACRTLYSFDGELPQQGSYIYGQDYGLGDLVEERNSDGLKNQMLITEQIFSSDNTGEKAYPTLVLREAITPGSWAAYDPSIDWSDEATTVHWDDIT